MTETLTRTTTFESSRCFCNENMISILLRITVTYVTDVIRNSFFVIPIAIWRKNNLEDMHWDKYFFSKKCFICDPDETLYFISKSVSGSIAIWIKNNLEDMHWDKYFFLNVLFVISMNFVLHKQVCIWLHSNMEKKII